MDRKTGRPIISLKFKAAAPPDAVSSDERAGEAMRKPQVSGREPLVMPKIPSRRQGVREVMVAKPAPPPPAAMVKPPEQARPVPIPPAAFKSATRAATEAVSAVLADPGWQSAELQRSYQEAKLHALPVHRKKAKLISGIVLKRLAPDLPENETRSLAMRAAYAAAFASLIDSAQASAG